jgi:lysozyme family protein
MTDRFPACLAETLRHEGGWSEVREDPGGATMKGVTIAVYAGYIGIPLTPATTPSLKARLRNITDAELKAIYGKNYWGAARCGEMPVGVDLAVFDVAVNSGVGRAAKLLQKVVGATQDGHIGAATLAAVKRADPPSVVRNLMAERRAFLRRLPTFWRFGTGWMRRCDAIEAAAIAASGPAGLDDTITVVTAPAPLPDADAQSATQGRAVAPDPKPPVATEVTLAATGIATNIGGWANGFAKVYGMQGNPNVWAIVLAFLSEPLFLTSIVTLVGALMTYLWRRKHA